MSPLTHALTLAAALPLASSGGPGELDARVVRVRIELDVFAPVGRHEKCGVQALVPLCQSPQIPLRIAIALDPPGEATAWRIDELGMLSVDLMEQIGEKHVGLVADVDLLLMNGVGYDDACKKTSLAKRSGGSAVERWLRPLPGANPADPDFAKTAATLKGKAGDLLLLVRGADELVQKRVREDATATSEAGEALRKGGATTLGQARLTAGLALAHGVPSRLLIALPATGGELHYLADFHSADLGWLRLDLAHRKAPAFPWPELADIAMGTIDADTPLSAPSRPRAVSGRGRITAGPKLIGQSPYVCRELHATTCTRATAKEILPVLVEAFAEAAKGTRKPNEVIDVLSTPRAQKSRALLEWSAQFAKLLGQ